MARYVILRIHASFKVRYSAFPFCCFRIVLRYSNISPSSMFPRCHIPICGFVIDFSSRRALSWLAFSCSSSLSRRIFCVCSAFFAAAFLSAFFCSVSVAWFSIASSVVRVGSSRGRVAFCSVSVSFAPVGAVVCSLSATSCRVPLFFLLLFLSSASSVCCSRICP